MIHKRSLKRLLTDNNMLAATSLRNSAVFLNHRSIATSNGKATPRQKTLQAIADFFSDSRC